MNAMMIILFRCVVIIGGYIVASVAASAFLTAVILGSAGLTEQIPVAAPASFAFSVPIVALLISYGAFFPAMLAILAGEIFAKRDWLFYALGGAIVAAILLGYDRSVETGSEVPIDLTLGLVMIGAGMVGGIGYWLVAGRTAGSWRQPRRDVTSPAP